MLLPGDNYSEQLMFTIESYRETWVDGRTARLYAEAFQSLSEASNISKADKAQIAKLKGEFPGNEVVDFALDAFEAGRKGLRFSKAAAPLILADGPLPFGDVIFAVALGIDFGIAAYNLVNRDD
jgi:hypothetical protein